MQNNVTLDIETVGAIASFIKKAALHIKNLEAEVAESKTKVASDNRLSRDYHSAIQKLAKVIDSADLDFLVADFDMQQFVKKASTNPNYLVQTLEAMFNASQVTSLGKTASYAPALTYNPDPVYRRAFGIAANHLFEY